MAFSKAAGPTALAMVAAVAAGTVWWGAAASSPGVRLAPDDARLVALGSTVYAGNCASCHGADLEGQPDWKVPGPDGRLPAPPHDETGHTWHHDDATLFALTKHGLAAMLGPDSTYGSNMPAYEGVLSDGEMIAVLPYIKSRWPRHVRERHDAINEPASK